MWERMNRNNKTRVRYDGADRRWMLALTATVVVVCVGARKSDEAGVIDAQTPEDGSSDSCINKEYIDYGVNNCRYNPCNTNCDCNTEGSDDKIHCVKLTGTTPKTLSDFMMKTRQKFTNGNGQDASAWCVCIHLFSENYSPYVAKYEGMLSGCEDSTREEYKMKPI